MASDPISIINRYEALNGLIEERLLEMAWQYDHTCTVAQYASRLARDDLLVAWERERKHLVMLLPLGYPGGQAIGE